MCFTVRLPALVKAFRGPFYYISAVLPIKQYQLLLEELEELEDIRAYDKAKAKKEKPLPLRDAIQQRRKKQKA